MRELEIFEEPLDCRSGLNENWFVVGVPDEGRDLNSPEVILGAFPRRHDAEVFLAAHKDITRLPEYQEYKGLAEGFRFSGTHQGLKYEADICWEEDRHYNLEIEHVETVPGSQMRFWLGEFLSDFDSDLLVDLVGESPEVMEFQRRINVWCDTVPEDLADIIIETYHEKGG